MDIHIATLDDLKKCRPDLYLAIKQEICLGELRLTKDDIISLIDPLSENIREHLKPYLPHLPAMTYNDIVDMENDIVDEISEQLQNEFDEIERIVKGETKRKNKRFVAPAPIINDTCKLDLYIATLEDLKRHRADLCDLLYDEFLKTHPMASPNAKSKSKEDVTDVTNGVKIGDVIRWNYTKEEGIVAGFDNKDGICNIIVRLIDGTKTMFENDPKLFTIVKEKKTD